MFSCENYNIQFSYQHNFLKTLIIIAQQKIVKKNENSEKKEPKIKHKMDLQASTEP